MRLQKSANKNILDEGKWKQRNK